MKKALNPTSSPTSSNDPISKKDLDEIKTELGEIKSLIKEFKKNLKGLVEIQQRLVHERLSVPVPPSPKEYGEEPSCTKTIKINITSIDDNRIMVSGSTFDFKTAIKTAGLAKWEGGTKSWSLPSECLETLIQNLEAVNLVRDTDFSVDVKKSDNKDEGFGSGFTD